jgi:chemotaxis protein MotB
MARRNPRRRRMGGHEEEHEDGERWLLTYADMITLLMALFMVLFSMTAVNKSKYEVLQRTLKDAFTARILPGGPSLADAGSDAQSREMTPKDAANAAVAQRTRTEASVRELADLRAENVEFLRLKHAIDSYAAAHGLAGKLQSTITRRGLRIRLLTDRVVFASNQATLQAPARPLLERIAALLRTAAAGRSIQVDGHTDSEPIHGGAFPDNWALSTARAATVVRALIADGVSPGRLAAGGFAYHHPVASNATPAGRARNRRVEILLSRRRVATQGATP